MFTKRILFVMATSAICAGLVAGRQHRTLEGHTRATNEPVLVVDVTGDTLLGPTHAHLAVYNSGNACYSSAVSGKRYVETRTLKPERVEALTSQLTGAGAWKLTDQEDWATDVPLTTVTVLSGETDARAHTYSYWIATDGSYKQVQTLIDAFVSENFVDAQSPFSTPGK